MSKINKDLNLIQFQKTDLRSSGISKENTDKCQNGVEFTDFSNPKAESLGRSQVAAKADNIESDIKFMMRYPDQVRQANMFFDNAFETFKEANQPESYEKASMLTNSFKNEFLSK